MRTKYSKSSSDISHLTSDLLKRDDDLLAKQTEVRRSLEQYPLRKVCLNCSQSLSAVESFSHRGLSFLRCAECSHIQTKNEPPLDYPVAADTDQTFSQIYTELSNEEFRSRQETIYTPKLRWVLEHQDVLADHPAMTSQSWCELGCGAGYFLNSLKDFGVNNMTGFEAESALTERANQRLGSKVVQHSQASLSELVSSSSADIYVAWFVLEHAQDLCAIWRAFADKPSGTLFAFSVPMYSFATMLETAFSTHYARNLDGVYHTQLFTDASINKGLELAGMEPVGSWIFGQDASDMLRLLSKALSPHHGEGMQEMLAETLKSLVDPLQSAVDQAHLADARHILARKV